MMKKLTILLGFGALWFAGAASAGDLILTSPGSHECGIDSEYGISEGDVTGDQTSSDSENCWGTFGQDSGESGNDPGPGNSIIIDGVEYEFVSKFDVGGGTDGVNIGLGASSGTWSYDPNEFVADEFLIVLKAADHPGFAIYLVSGDNYSGTYRISWSGSGTDDYLEPYGDWNTACFDDPDDILKECAGLSHISIYASSYRVPEPGTAALLGLSLIGLGMARRRRQS